MNGDKTEGEKDNAVKGTQREDLLAVEAANWLLDRIFGEAGEMPESVRKLYPEIAERIEAEE